MRKLVLAAFSASALLAAPVSSLATEGGAAAGAVTGGTAGAIVGGPVGAAVGAGAGAIVGGAASGPDRDRVIVEERAPATTGSVGCSTTTQQRSDVTGTTTKQRTDC
jgi:uncharacterized protein YcfJ